MSALAEAVPRRSIEELWLNERQYAILRPSTRDPIDVWVEKRISIPNKPFSGKWSNDTFPILTPIMVMIVSRLFSFIAVAAAPQKGKTAAAIINVMLYCLFELRLDVMYMNTSVAKADGIWQKKIKPVIEASMPDQLALPTNEAGRKQLRHFVNGKSLYVNGADTAANLAADSIPVILCDDVGDYKADVNNKGFPSELAFKRAESYGEREKILVEAGTISTRENRAWARFESGTQWRPYVPCPGCGTYQLILRERMVYHPESIHKTKRDTSMRCENGDCTYLIRDTDLGSMLPRHVWVGRGQRIEDGHVVGELEGEPWRTKIVPGETRFGEHHPENVIGSFWWNAYYWPKASWGDLLARYIASRGNPDAEKEFQIHVDVEPWIDPTSDQDKMTVEEMATHVEEAYKLGTVPDGVELITLTTDVGMYEVHWTAIGWSSDGAAWLIDFGVIKVTQPKGRKNMSPEDLNAFSQNAIQHALDKLRKVELDGWPTSNGATMNPVISAVDAGYMPDAVCEWARNRGGRKWAAVVGAKNPEAPITPRKTTRLKGKYMVYELGVHQAKIELRERLRRPRGVKGYWSIGTGKDLTGYFPHMCGEELKPVTDNRGRVKLVWHRVGVNHWWDCTVYGLCLALQTGVKLLGKPEKPSQGKWFKNARKRRR